MDEFVPHILRSEFGVAAPSNLSGASSSVLTIHGAGAKMVPGFFVPRIVSEFALTMTNWLCIYGRLDCVGCIPFFVLPAIQIDNWDREV